MHNIDDATRKEILSEVLLDELKAIHEYVKDVPALRAKLDQVADNVEGLTTDMHLVKVAVRETNHDLQNLAANVKTQDRDLGLLKRRTA